MSLTLNLVQNYRDHFGNSWRSSLSPTGGAKSTYPTTENWLRKLCTYSMNYNTSDEDNKSWHKLHQQAQVHEHRHAKVAHVSTHWERVVFVCTPLDVVSHAHHCSRCSWVSLHPIFIHERLSLTWPSSLSTSTWPSSSSSTSPSWCTPSSTLSSTTWTPCNTTCAPPRTRWVTTPTTSTPPSQVMSPTTLGHRRHYTRQAAHRSTTTLTPWLTTCAPPRRGVTTPATSPSPSHFSGDCIDFHWIFVVCVSGWSSWRCVCSSSNLQSPRHA